MMMEAVPVACLVYFGVSSFIFSGKSASKDPQLIVLKCVLKCIPIWLMALACLFAPHASTYATYIGAGLAISSIGDFALEINGSPLASFVKADLFLVGLVSFLIAHVLYIAAFVLEPVRQPLLLPGLSMFFFYAYGVSMFSVLCSSIPLPLRAPTFIYVMVIATMGHRAFTRYHHIDPPSDPKSGLYGLLGALSFMVSDTVLAVDKFLAPMSWAKLAIMTTYYVGQYGIALSVLTQNE
jgi:uncharacterized membrane protein YhhN